MESTSVEVTTLKPKNPGRVEWGKQLGKMSKERKLKKEDTTLVTLPNIPEQPKLFVSPNLVIAGISALLIGIGLFMYTRKGSSPPPEVQIKQPVFEEIKTSNFSDF